MAKKPRAAKTNTLGLKNKSKTAARRAGKKKARPMSKAAAKKKPAGKGKKASQNKEAGHSKKFPKAEAKPAAKAAPAPKAAPKAAPQAAAPAVNEQEIANRLLVGLAQEAAPAVPPEAVIKPTNPTENFFHSKAKALRDSNARFSQHARDNKHGGRGSPLAGAQKGKRGK